MGGSGRAFSRCVPPVLAARRPETGFGHLAGVKAGRQHQKTSAIA